MLFHMNSHRNKCLKLQKGKVSFPLLSFHVIPTKATIARSLRCPVRMVL